jgi:hypothetical protein
MKIEIDTTKLKQQIADNPLLAAGVGAALLNGTAKLMDANSKRKNANSWKKEVARRDRNR